MFSDPIADHVDVETHRLDDDEYRSDCRRILDRDGALVLHGFLRDPTIQRLVVEALALESDAFHSHQTHSVYLEPPDTTFPSSDARSRAIVSTKGAITTDGIPSSSPLHTIYESTLFRAFLGQVLGEDALFEYDDPLSSINVNFYQPGQELGWHFDNSSFSVTLLLQSAIEGGTFEFIDTMRDAEAGDDNTAGVARALDGQPARAPMSLDQQAGDLALFRGRNALHHVSPVSGNRTRILVVFAYNTEPGLSLSANARKTFFGRLN